MKTATSVDGLLRQKAADWLSVNRAIQAAKSVNTGSVLMRDLHGLLKEEHVVDTENLCTLLVVVPKSLNREWYDWYEKMEVDDLKNMMGESGAYAARVAMPKSSVVICEDQDNLLVTVVVLRRFVDAVKGKLRERKFQPRDYTLEKDSGESKEKSLVKLLEQRKNAKIELIKMCKAWFSELFTCWTHLKVVRVWVESVVRFSLPAEYDVMLIRPTESKFKERIRQVLQTLFKDLVAEGVLDVGGIQDNAVPGIPAFVGEDLYPYVFSEINLVART